MKCPNCGEEMTEGTLYCEHCGEDIHIVPDFEPELEFNMEQTLNGILGEMTEQTVERSQEPEQKPQKKYPLWSLLILMTVIVVAAAVGLGFWVYLYNSEEHQVKQAIRYTEEGDYGKAIACYNRALELNEKDIEIRFGLAEVYLQKNNKVEYEYLLREIAGDENATDEQLDRAYGKLIAIYRARGDYQAINDLLLATNNETLKSTYQNYIARTPEFSIKEGDYTGIQALKLTAFGTGNIYYTLDGSEPDENSIKYITPILLEKGRYVIKAVFINENEIVSDVAVGEFNIDNDEIPEPEISAASGEYSVPVYIEILDEGEEEIYYTMDGTDPTYLSPLYTAPIPMPLGKSTFKFAKIVGGVVGDIAERTYQLTLNTDYTPAQAVEDILKYYLDTGKIRDDYGHFDDSDDMYKFYYQYVIGINEISHFYVISEVYQSADGTLTKTGTNYAVDVYNRDQFKLYQDNMGRYELAPMEINK